MSWEDGVRKVVPYVPGEQPKRAGIIKLNTNENPYPPAPGVKKALEGLCYERMRLYPDPESGELVEALAAYYGLSEKQVFVGVGSDDVLALAFLTFFNKEKPILFPDITYSFYDVWADLFRIPFQRIPLDETFRILPKDYIGRGIPMRPQALRCLFRRWRRSSRQTETWLLLWMRHMWISERRARCRCLSGMRICWWCRLFPSQGQWRGCGSALRWGMKS